MDAHRIRDGLARLVRRYQVPGAQLVIDHDGTTIAVETGEREAGSGRAVTRTDQFPLGSVTKAFTATLAMQLVADGDLDLDAPVTDYVPELKASPDDHFIDVTPRRLMSHMAGLVSNHNLDGPDAETVSLRRYALDCADLPPLHPPGERFSYANTGYVLLGHVIEVASQQTWWDAVDEFLLGPLDIDPKFLVGPPSRLGTGGPTVMGHTVRLAQREVRPVGTYMPATYAPAGGLALSAGDVVKLARMHCRDSDAGLLSAAEIIEMHTPVDGADAFGLADGWCLGLASFRSGSTTWLGHDGGTEGATCNLRFDPVGGSAVALTTNATSGLMLWPDLAGLLAEEGLAVGVQRVPPLPAVPVAPPDCAGEYHNGEIRWSVRASGTGGLLMRDDTGIQEEVSMHDGSVFVTRRTDIDDSPTLGRFLRDPSTGRISHMQLSGRVYRRDAGSTSVPS